MGSFLIGWTWKVFNEIHIVVPSFWHHFSCQYYFCGYFSLSCLLQLSRLRQRILSSTSLSRLTPTNSRCPHFSLKSVLFKERNDNLLGKFKGIWGGSWMWSTGKTLINSWWFYSSSPGIVLIFEMDFLSLACQVTS